LEAKKLMGGWGQTSRSWTAPREEGRDRKSSTGRRKKRKESTILLNKSSSAKGIPLRGLTINSKSGRGARKSSQGTAWKVSRGSDEKRGVNDLQFIVQAVSRDSQGRGGGKSQSSFREDQE